MNPIFYLDKGDDLWILAGIMVIGWLIFGCVALVIDNLKEQCKDDKSKKAFS